MDTDVNSSTFLAAVKDMEDAFQALHAKVSAVKAAAQLFHMPESSGGTLVKESTIVKESSTIVKESTIGSNGKAVEEDFSMGTSDIGITNGSQAEALQRSYFQGERLREITEAADSRPLINVSGFLEFSDDSDQFNMDPEWMEIGANSKRALMESASSRGDMKSLETFIKVSLAASNPSVGESSSIPEPSCSDFGQPMHPSSNGRKVWDMLAAILLLLDVFSMPIVFAWEVELSNSRALLIMAWISVFYWALDIVASFNTGFYINGELDMNRFHITKRYLKSWLIFDVLIVAVDVLTLSSQDASEAMLGLRSSRALLRAPRMLRAARLLRLAQMQRFHLVIEEVAVVTRRPWLLILISMITPLLKILVISHILACFWYYIGSTTQKAGLVSWLKKEEALNINAVLQYFHALQWLLTPPGLPDIEPANTLERACNILMVIFSLTLMGSALGQFTSAVQDMSAMEAEKNQKRRETRIYLQNQNISAELIARIMRFVEYKLSEQDPGVALDMSLLTPTLQMELFVAQRGPILEKHPFFDLVSELYPTAYAKLCGAVKSNAFEQDEAVFVEGDFATAMVITSGGLFTLRDKKSKQFTQVKTRGSKTSISGVQWFAEAALFLERPLHTSTLVADGYSDVLALARPDVQAAVKDIPHCSHMCWEYAKEFLSGLKSCDDTVDAKQAVEISDKAVKQNVYYMERHPDPNLLLSSFRSGDDLEVSKSDSLEVEFTCDVLELDEDVQHLSVEGFVKIAVDGGIRDQVRLSRQLQTRFVELHPEHGSHTKFSRDAELDRSVTSCLCILNLVADQYANFTLQQDPASRLTEKQWQELRKIIQWISPTPLQVHAVLVLLTIKHLGKSKRLLQQLPHKSRLTPEDAVIFLIKSQRNMVPSVQGLDQSTQQLLIDTLDMYKTFNLAQMLQGENTPGNCKQLKDMIKEDSSLLKFYILFFLGLMSGVAGGSGSKFMNSKNAESIIMCCRVFETFMSTPPCALFWNYMLERAGKLSLVTQTPEDLAVLRLACLARVQDRPSYQRLRNSWMDISIRSRNVLTSHFLADGITERAFKLEFFPDCIKNATSNPVVRLPALLEIIVELLEKLTTVAQSKSRLPKGSMLVTVDLTDMASFISMVKNRFVFQTCIMRSNIRLRGSARIELEMTTDNWSRTNDAESDLTTLGHDVKHILKKLQSESESLEAPQRSANRLNPLDFYV